MDGDEWWEGELNGKVGYFPKLYVEVIKEESSRPDLQRTKSTVTINKKKSEEEPRPTLERSRSAGSFKKTMEAIKNDAASKKDATPGTFLLPLVTLKVLVHQLFHTAHCQHLIRRDSPERRSKQSLTIKQAAKMNCPSLSVIIFPLFKARFLGIDTDSRRHHRSDIDWWWWMVGRIFERKGGIFPKALRGNDQRRCCPCGHRYKSLFLFQMTETLLKGQPQLRKATALFDYEAASANELSILPGDIITLLSTEVSTKMDFQSFGFVFHMCAIKFHCCINASDLISCQDDEWWEGELNGKIGFFPKNYVEIGGASAGFNL